MKKIIVVILLYCYIVLLAKSVYAVTTTILNFPQIILSDPFTIDVSISGASAGNNYLRIDLYKSSTNNYFGETFNGSSWYGGNEAAQYFPITIQSGQIWNGQLQGQLGSQLPTDYSGPGNYKMRVRRYTSSGSYNSTEANNNAVDVDIEVPLPTPTLVQTPTPSSTPITTPLPTPTVTPTLTPISPAEASAEAGTQIPTPTPISYDNIFISEAMVNPPSSENEWIEIYNNNDFSVSLTNWFIDDIENGGSSPKMFSLDIASKSYGIYELTSSMFNNSGDNIRLLDFNKNLKDSFEYSSSTQGKTYGRISFDNDDFCLQEPSKGSVNNSCINPTPTSPAEASAKAGSPTPTKIPLNLSTTAVSNRLINQFHPVSINQLIDTNNIEDSQGEIMGISTSSKKNNKPLINSLSFVSFSYSILSVVSLLFKLNFFKKFF